MPPLYLHYSIRDINALLSSFMIFNIVNIISENLIVSGLKMLYTISFLFSDYPICVYIYRDESEKITN